MAGNRALVGCVMKYRDYPRETIKDIVRLRRRLDVAHVPPRRTDFNFILGTWNIRHFGGVYDGWNENPDSPKRNLRGLAVIAEIIRRFDVVAIQELRRETTALRRLLEDFLGPDWAVIMSDVTVGDRGNQERLAYLYDTRRVMPSGLAGEIVLPPTGESNEPVEQFDRTPYLVGFRAGSEHFTLLTAHIRYGDVPADRLGELRRIAEFTAREIRDRTRDAETEETNLLVLGDFNIDKRIGDPLFDAFVDSGLWVPEGLRGLKTTYGTEPKFYDQIAWFRDRFSLLPSGRAGTVDFTDAVFQELDRDEMTWRVSDHFPLWVEFNTDRSERAMAKTLGLPEDMPNPFSDIPD